MRMFDNNIDNTETKSIKKTLKNKWFLSLRKFPHPVVFLFSDLILHQSIDANLNTIAVHKYLFRKYKCQLLLFRSRM